MPIYNQGSLKKWHEKCNFGLHGTRHFCSDKEVSMVHKANEHELEVLMNDVIQAMSKILVNMEEEQTALLQKNTQNFSKLVDNRGTLFKILKRSQEKLLKQVGVSNHLNNKIPEQILAEQHKNILNFLRSAHYQSKDLADLTKEILSKGILIERQNRRNEFLKELNAFGQKGGGSIKYKNGKQTPSARESATGVIDGEELI